MTTQQLLEQAAAHRRCAAALSTAQRAAALKQMARALESYFDGSFLGSLRAVMEPDREDNRTVFAVLKEEDVPRALAAIEEVNGSFDEPGTGVAFTLPVDDVRGLHKNY